jgi:preprotein translocase subunit SecD
LKGSAVITAADVQDAQAMPDPNDERGAGWLVRLEFTPDGAKRFETYTGEHIKQRFAIVVDGVVMSAPLIQTRIPGGIATITMGNASPDQQKKDAQQLARALGGE